ncbi:MAG: alkaline phosphatase, partial [Kiritimatiellaceae bacterium]|nr:alkaline phosphatase [Kiritimatiellaceae bacterium]
MKKILTVIYLFISLTLFGEEAVPKNIILFIGDGMGVSQVTAGKVTKGTLEMERCPVAALVTTWSSNSLVTDSAAGGTAMATGVKTKNGMIAQDPRGKQLKTVLEFAEEKNKSTGLVSTCAVTHATPASFASHVPSRKQYEEIARQLAASDVDVLFGGGLEHFDLPSLAMLQKKMTMAKTTKEF